MSFFHPILILVPFRNDNLVRRDKPTDSVVKILFRLRHKVILGRKKYFDKKTRTTVSEQSS